MMSLDTITDKPADAEKKAILTPLFEIYGGGPRHEQEFHWLAPIDHLLVPKTPLQIATDPAYLKTLNGLTSVFNFLPGDYAIIGAKDFKIVAYRYRSDIIRLCALRYDRPRDLTPTMAILWDCLPYGRVVPACPTESDLV
jgi:hypothetical protein